MSIKGRSEVSRYLLQRVPAALEKKLLRGAAKAAGEVLANEAKARVASQVVREAIVVRSRHKDGVVRVEVTVTRRWPRSLAYWLEYGTSRHFISVDDGQRRGRGTRRLNQQLREAKGDASLVIGGKFVGATVLHPGARPHPFLRPALDTKASEAVTAAQNYITVRLAREGLGGPDLPENDDG